MPNDLRSQADPVRAPLPKLTRERRIPCQVAGSLLLALVEVVAALVVHLVARRHVKARLRAVLVRQHEQGHEVTKAPRHLPPDVGRDGPGVERIRGYVLRSSLREL